VATEKEIEALRHIGPTLAKRIVADRDSFGPFGSMDGLKRVKGSVSLYGSKARLCGNLLARSASYKQSHIQAIRTAKSTQEASL
jgi:hypothetical protein